MYTNIIQRLCGSLRLASAVFAISACSTLANAQLIYNSGSPNSMAGLQPFQVGFPYFGAFEDSGNQWMKNTWMAGRYFTAGQSATLGDIFIPLSTTQQPVRLQLAKVTGVLTNWNSYSWLGNVVTSGGASPTWVEFDFTSQNIALEAGATYMALLGVTNTNGIWNSNLNYWWGTAGVEPNVFVGTYAPGFYQPVPAYQQPDYFYMAQTNYTPGIYVEAAAVIAAPLPTGAVPEPSTYGLLGAAALVALGVLRRYIRR